MSIKSVFVTVGTTKFDELCDIIVDVKSLEVLKKLGYSKLTIQIGNSVNNPGDFSLAGVSVTSYRFKDNIAEDIRNADLVISHAGAGTCLEVLDLNKPLLVVINTNLMDNHQIEIAEQLHIDGHLYYCTCDTLTDTLQNVDFSILKPYSKADSTLFFDYLDKFMGLKTKR